MYYDENAKLNEMIDMNSKPVFTLAYRLNMEPAVLFDLLSCAYETAKENGKVYTDSDGIGFETEYASITLKPNTDLSSPYLLYLKFVLKDGYPCEIGNQDMSQLPETLGQVNMTAKTIERINQFVTGEEDENMSDEILARLNNGYQEAKNNNAFIAYGKCLTFDTGLCTLHGEPIRASVKPWNGTWVLNYVGYDEIYTQKYFSAAIKEFSNFNESCLSAIAEVAKAEKWYFGDEIGNYDILQNYISYTFYRLEKENKICVNSTGDFAAFNTGLPSATYDDIYMCFKRNGSSKDTKWKYEGICTAKGGFLWKKLISSFNPLPKSAEYFNRKEDILFDMNKLVYTDAEHIIYDRLHRMPVDFLRPSFINCERGMELLDRIENETSIAFYYDELKEIVAEDAKIFNDIRERLEQLVNKTVRIIRWNYRLAIPSYNPKSNTMSLLLPLDFTESGSAQAALVVQMTESGNYIGHTLLNMRQAYLNARLISSQERSWLTA